MSKVLVSESSLEAIADAIRAVSGGSDTYTPAEMGPAIEELQGASSIIDNPSYFYDECVDTAQKIDALRSSSTFVMYFITDSHVYTSGNNMQYLDAQLASMYAVSKMIKPNLVVHGGDMTNGSEAKATTIGHTNHIVSAMREIGGDDTLILIGNHDGNTVQGTLDNEDERITEAEMLDLYRSWDDGFTYAGDQYQGGGFYGYRDYSSLGLRVIRLHSYRENIGNSDYDGGKGMNWGYYADEVDWFESVALNTDYAVLIVCHQSLSPVLQGFSESQEIPHNGIEMQEALDDWLDADSDHRCVGVIHGHVHWDYSAKGKGTFSVIDHETKQTTSRTGTHGDFFEHGQCLCNFQSNYGASDSTPTSSYRDVPVDAVFRGRTSGTATQGLWTAVIVNTESETVSFVRFGAGSDKTYGYGATTYYSVTSNLTYATNSNSSTSVASGESYRATITPYVGCEITSCSVTMGGTDITSTAYRNGVVSIAAVTGNVVITVTAVLPKVNQLPTSVDTDGTIYNGTGYKANTRLNSSGTVSTQSGYYTTGFMPVEEGDLIEFVNITLDADNSISGYNYQYIAFYDSTKTLLSSCSMYARDWVANYGSTLINPYTMDSTNLTSITPHGNSGGRNLTNIAYFRISAKLIDGTSAIMLPSKETPIPVPATIRYNSLTVVQSDIPNYVRTAAETLADKVRAVQSSGTITFLAMSDAHDLLGNSDIQTGLRHAGMAAKIVGMLAPIDFAFHGGDATMGSSTTTRENGLAEIVEVNRWIDEAFAGVPNFRTVGNHDALNYTTTPGFVPFTDTELFLRFGIYNNDGTAVIGSTTAGYCYRDFSTKQVRVICLNTSDDGEDGVSTAQQLWFCQTLASVPSGYGVVILSHYPLDWGGIAPAANIVYAYYSNSSYTVGGTTVSFSSCNPAYVVCFHGHTHNYLAAKLNRISNNVGTPFDVWRIATPNVCFNRNNEYGQNAGTEYFGIEYGESMTYSKTADSAEDTAFVVNVIDPTNECVHSFHYGAGRDRVVGIGATVYHVVTTSLTHATLTGGSSVIEDGQSYSATVSADSGYELTSVTVMHGSTNVTSTAYNSSTGAISIASVTSDITITAVATEIMPYTNLVPTAEDSSGNIVGYKDGYYASGSGKVGDFTASSGFVATGGMQLPSGWQYIYVKGVPMLSNDSHERYYFGDASKNVYSSGGYINATNYSSQYMTITSLGTNYYRISSTHTNTTAAKWFCMSFKASTGANLIITVDEPIE